MKRDPLSKRLRFEIFKRDGFKCVYCGAPPTAGVLHVDHIKPVSDGGTNDAENLVTACPDCNLGKSAVPLDRVSLRQFDPDTALEHAEQLRAWTEAQREVVKAKRDVEQEMVNLWCASMDTDRCSKEVPRRLLKLSAEWPMDRIVEALQIVGAKRGIYNDTDRLRYMYGVFRKWREDAEIDSAREWCEGNLTSDGLPKTEGSK